MREIMKNYKSLVLSLGLGFIILGILLYMFISFQSDSKSEIIYFVSKTNSENSTFWHSVQRGVKVAGDELGLDVVFVGPEREIDLEEQVQYVRDGIEINPMAIILAASDYNVLSQVSSEVIEEGITFITVDSDVNIASVHSFIATDNQKAAKKLAKTLVDIIGEEGKVGMVAHLENTTSSIERLKGFCEGIQEYSQINLIEDIPYSNNESETAYVETLNLIEKNPDIKGIFGTNEATLIGIAKAVDELDLGDDLIVVGFDISKEAAFYLEKGIIKAIIIQRPFNMGYLSVKEAYEQNKRKKKVEFISVDVVLVTKENMFDEDIQKFLIPFLE